MPHLTFAPKKKEAANYVLLPWSRHANQALGVIFSYGDLPAIANAALQKGEYANTDYGHGLEYPTRPDRADQVRIWRWEWRNRKGKAPEGRDQTHKIIRRKWHIPEKTYLGVLVGVLECNGYMQEAAKICAAKILEPITVQYKPNIFAVGQYKLEPFSYEAQHCLFLALYLKNLEQTRELAISRTGVTNLDENAYKYSYGYVPDQFRQRELRFEAGNIVWEYYTTKNGQFEKAKQVLPEDLYFDILEQLLFIHGLPTLRDATSVLPTLRFEPNPHSRLNYEITPQAKIHVALLETIIAWVRLSDWVNMVLKPQPYGMQIRLEDDSGVMVLGDEVTLTLPDHSQQKIEKNLFLSVLAAILKARGVAEAASIRALVSLEHEVVVQYLPDLYWTGNYCISPFDARAWDCLDLFLCRNNLELPIQEAETRSGFQYGYYHPTFGLVFRTDGTVLLKVPNGNDRIVPQSLYLAVLEQVRALHSKER